MKEHVNHPPHYGGEENPYETIKVIEAWGLGFCPGNAVKYISRAGKKNPQKEIEDLEKAIWYLNREIEKLKKIPKKPFTVEGTAPATIVRTADEMKKSVELLNYIFGQGPLPEGETHIPIVDETLDEAKKKQVQEKLKERWEDSSRNIGEMVDFKKTMESLAGKAKELVEEKRYKTAEENFPENEDIVLLEETEGPKDYVVPTLSDVVDYLSGEITTGGDKIITIRKTNQDGEEQITEENPLMGETKETSLEDFAELEEPPKSKPLVVDIDDVIDAVLEKDKTAFDALNVGEIVEIKSVSEFGNNIEGTLRYVISSGREHIVPFKTENNAIEHRDYIVVEDNEENSSNIDLIAIEVKGVTYLLKEFEWKDWDILEEKISNELKIGDLFRVLTLSFGEGTLRLKTRTQEKLTFTSTDSLNLDITYIVLKDNPGNILSKNTLTIKVNDRHYVVAEAFQFGGNPKES
jgi:hypothetical protein